MQPIYLFLALLVIASLAYIPIKSEQILRQISLGGAVLYTILAGWLAIPALFAEPQFYSQDWWFLDPFAAFFLVLISFLFLSASIVSYRYIGHEMHERIIQLKQVRLYQLSLPLFILSMTAAVLTNNIGVLWVALEATTLTTTFLVAFYTKDASLEAAWKYILICSTGIALGLLGILMFAFAGNQAGGLDAESIFNLAQLREHATTFLPEIVRWAFVFIFIGIGTKVGFVPMHTWLPDAHSKTPSPISGILSGVLLNVALYTILRFKLVADLSLGNTWWTERFFLVFGVMSIVLPAFMIYIQRNYKRMLAYSSIEHMGLAAFAIGLGPFGVVPAMMHLVGHAIGKSMLFFGSGEILMRYKTTKIEQVRQLLKTSPYTAVLFLLGLLGLLAVPPSALFASEFLMIGYGMQSQWILTLVVLVALTIIFVSMIRHTLTMFYAHDASESDASSHMHKEGWTLTHTVMAAHLLLLVVVGVYFLTIPGIKFMSGIVQSISANL